MHGLGDGANRATGLMLLLLLDRLHGHILALLPVNFASLHKIKVMKMCYSIQFWLVGLCTSVGDACKKSSWLSDLGDKLVIIFKLCNIIRT